MPFWIDTICIPRERSLRNLGIRTLVRVYAKSDKVLVMDKSIQYLSSADSTPAELMFYASICPWTRRLWTFQEGVLGKFLFLDFADRPRDAYDLLRTWIVSDAALKLDMKTLVKHRKEHETPVKLLLRALATDDINFRATLGDCSVLGRDTAKYVPDFPSAADARLANWINWWIDLDPIYHNTWKSIVDIRFLGDKAGSERLTAALHGIQGRTTSRLEDESICIANLMNLDPLPLLATAHAERMQLLLRTIAYIPARSIFLVVPRLTIAGFRWAPTSFLNAKGQIKVNDQLGRLYQWGLCISLPGIRFTLISNLPPKPILSVNICGVLLSLAIRTPKRTDADSDLNWGDFASVSDSLIVVLDKIPYGDFEIVHGALVSSEREDNDQSQVSYCQPLVVERLGKSSTDAVLANGVWLPKSHEWCIT